MTLLQRKTLAGFKVLAVAGLIWLAILAALMFEVSNSFTPPNSFYRILLMRCLFYPLLVAGLVGAIVARRWLVTVGILILAFVLTEYVSRFSVIDRPWIGLLFPFGIFTAVLAIDPEE